MKYNISQEGSDKKRSVNEITQQNLVSKTLLKRFLANSPLYQMFSNTEINFITHPFLGFKGRFISKQKKPKITVNKELFKGLEHYEKIAPTLEHLEEIGDQKTLMAIFNLIDFIKTQDWNNNTYSIIVNDILSRNSLKSILKVKEKVQVDIEGKKIKKSLVELNGFLWDMAFRPSAQNPVHVITKDHKSDKYLFIIQPRSPLNKLVISSPAGLINPKISFSELREKFSDDKETLKKLSEFESMPKFKKGSIEDKEMITALAELKEETGILPLDLNRISPNPLPKSAGMTDESAVIIEAIVDKKKWGKSKFDVDKFGNIVEDIKYVWLSPEKYIEVCKKMPKNLIVAELETWMYMYSMVNTRKKLIRKYKKEMDKFNKKIMKINI
jgi:hypothetical protein